MSDKRYDSKNRWRNKSIAFRGSPKEAAELDKRWRLCGYSSKQDYLLRYFLLLRSINRSCQLHLGSRHKDFYRMHFATV